MENKISIFSGMIDVLTKRSFAYTGHGNKIKSDMY